MADIHITLKVLYHRQCQYTQANEYHFDGANSIETTNHWVYLAAKTWITAAVIQDN